MDDREKAIKAFEICYTLGHNCTECPLFPEDDCNDKLTHDVLALLKELEATKPKIDVFGHPYCPKCKILVYETWRFCPHCGQELIWND